MPDSIVARQPSVTDMMKLENALRREKEKLELLKKERMAEVLDLKKRDEKVCQKMEVSKNGKYCLGF